jgi:acid phosphatase type 7
MVLRAPLAGLSLLGVLGCDRISAPSGTGGAGSTSQLTPTLPSFAAWPNEVRLTGAGDIAWCHWDRGDVATAKLLDTLPGTVFTAGDNVYP